MWEDILKRVPGSMTKRSKQLVDEVIDEIPRSINEILDLMFDKVKERRENKRAGYRTGKSLIPTRKELIKYLSDNYNSILVDKISGKEITSGKRTPYRETRYFR
tara:strand:+ start:1025 stop:1336 length:312 start_codon:yes stop_codon:yes gene_type:complete